MTGAVTRSRRAPSLRGIRRFRARLLHQYALHRASADAQRLADLQKPWPRPAPLSQINTKPVLIPDLPAIGSAKEGHHAISAQGNPAKSVALVARRRADCEVAPEAHTFLFVLAVLAIVPLAALLSHATEAVAAKTGDAVGGLLNATLGNLTELIIAVTALHAGQYLLVKASIAGAIVTNALLMLGASFLLGGLRYHVQEYNRAGGRLYSALLLIATVALLAPSTVADLDLAHGEVLTQKLSTGLNRAAHHRL
jgi:hypothetical protein